MRKTKAEAAETRKRILDAAALLFKKNGIQGTGVSEIMAAAGLTNGAFYRHFESKEQLVAEACAMNMDVFVAMASDAASKGPVALMAHMEAYLTGSYRDDIAGGCPVAAMSSELIRTDAEARHAISRGYEQIIDLTAKSLAVKDGAPAEDTAWYALSTMLGALTISRLLDNKEQSDRVLSVARARVMGLFSQSLESHEDSPAPKKVLRPGQRMLASRKMSAAA